MSDDVEIRSISYLKTIDLISDGPIEGLVDGAKSIYFDETPLHDHVTDAANFPRVSYDTRYGTNDQTYIRGFADTENEISDGTEITHASPVIKTITDSDINRVDLKLSFPSFFVLAANGKYHGSKVDITVDLQANGGGYNNVLTTSIEGKSTSAYERSYNIVLTGDAPWDLKITRVTADSVDVNTQNKSYLKSYTEIIDTKLRYPNSAVIATRIDAEAFSGVPQRAFDIKGIKVEVPSNYDPVTRIYTGSWDGTFSGTLQWTDNPSWIFYSLLTNTRFGLGSFVSADQIDKWALYGISQFCDELVHDGKGGFEPRFTCNICFQQGEEAFKVLNDIASIFRGMIYWTSGSLSTIQDVEADTSYFFNNSNVVDGVFEYSSASAKARHTVAIVTWNDPTDFYRQKMEYVEDQELVAQFGIISTNVVAVGCTSQGQAHRVGRWLLFTERYQSELVNFKTGTEASILVPGQIVEIADELRAGIKTGGRVAAIATTTITLDRELDFTSGGGTLSILLKDGTVESRLIVGQPASDTLIVDSSFTDNINIGSIWNISGPTVQTQKFRIISVTEDKDGPYAISAIKYIDGKFDFVENNIPLSTRTITELNPFPIAPTNVTITESLFEQNQIVRTKTVVSWEQASGAKSYVVSYLPSNGNLITLPQVFSNEIEILDLDPGTYQFFVNSVNGLGRISPDQAIKSATLAGKTAPPTDVSNFTMLPVSKNTGLFSWDQATDLDVLVGGIVRIRWSPIIGATDWNQAMDVAIVPGISTNVHAALFNGTYFAKFIDSSEVESDTAAIIGTTVPLVDALNVVDTETEDPAFTGAMTNVVYDGGVGGIVIDDTTLLTGTYNFANTVDLGASYPCRISISAEIQGYDPTNLFDDRTDNIDTWADFDGGVISDVNLQVYLRTTDDDPSGSPTWSDWKLVYTNEYTARGFQFKAVLNSEVSNHNIVVTALSATIDMPDRSEQAESISSGAGAYTVTFTDPFYAVPAVGIAAHNMATGDYFVIASKTVSGFQVTFKNAAGAAVSRTFDWIAKGYGRSV